MVATNPTQRTTLMSTSRAARLLRASVFALNRWQARGWLPRRGPDASGRRLIDVREAVLMVWLHNGPECVSDELVELVRRPGATTPADDPCTDLVGPHLHRAVRDLHACGYRCAEIQAAVERLSLEAV